jgi:hypothetical protein
MKNFKVGLTGLLAGVVLFVLGNLGYFATKGFYIQTAPGLWKAMPMPGWLIQLFLWNLVTGILFAMMFQLVKTALPRGRVASGFVYGLLLWLVGTTPGMISTYLTIAMPTALVLTWWIQGLVSNVIIGWVIAGILRNG